MKKLLAILAFSFAVFSCTKIPEPTGVSGNIKKGDVVSTADIVGTWATLKEGSKDDYLENGQKKYCNNFFQIDNNGVLKGYSLTDYVECTGNKLVIPDNVGITLDENYKCDIVDNTVYMGGVPIFTFLYWINSSSVAVSGENGGDSFYDGYYYKINSLTIPKTPSNLTGTKWIDIDSGNTKFNYEHEWGQRYYEAQIYFYDNTHFRYTFKWSEKIYWQEQGFYWDEHTSDFREGWGKYDEGGNFMKDLWYEESNNDSGEKNHEYFRINGYISSKEVDQDWTHDGEILGNTLCIFDSTFLLQK